MAKSPKQTNLTGPKQQQALFIPPKEPEPGLDMIQCKARPANEHEGRLG